MRHYKIKPGGGLKTRLFQAVIILVILFQSLLSNIVFQAKPAKAANNYSPQLSSITEPDLDTTEENGIWIDRARILLYWSSEPWADELPSHGFHAPSEDGLNKDIEYINDASSCDIIKDVTRGNFNSEPTRGVLHRCNGETVTVNLKNQFNAKLDGYIVDDVITMPRYLGHINNCTGPGSSADYKNDGVFSDKGRSDYADGDVYSLTDSLNGDSADSTYVYDVNTGGAGLIAEAKQQRHCVYTGVGAYMSYAGEGSGGGRTIYLLRNYNRDDVIQAALTKIDLYNSKRGRFSKLSAYFIASPTGQNAIETCKAGAGISGDRTAIILRLIDKPQGSDPFVDCMWRLLEGDDAFVAAMEYAYEGNYDENLIADSSGDCGDGGIPIVSDIACWLVGWVFDALHAGFKSVIDYLATPPDMFEEQNSTLAQSMKNLRNIANLIFVVAFLFVVFQYMTNINVVDAYFVKKFIPRLVIAVILVQASFFIVSELNYFFYDLGKSIQTIVFQGNDVGDLVVNNGAATLALTAGVALGPALIGLLLVIGVILLLVLLITMIVLAVRYILIIVLAILAPIAFAALAIPQLEGMTKKWFNMYIKLLLMYPMIMFFLAASAVVAGALSGGGIILQIISLVAAFLPFIILPFTFKFAGGLMGNVTAKIMKAPGKGYKAYKKGEGLYESKTASGRARAAERKLKDGIKADRASNAGSDRLSRKVRGMGSFRKQRLFGGEEEKYMGIVKDREDKRKADEAKSLLDTQLKGMPDRTAAVSHLNDTYHRAMASGDVHTANAAYAGLVGQQAEAELSRIQEEAHDTTNAAVNHEIYNRQQGSNYGDLKAFAPHLTGDVGHGGDLSAQRAKNLSALSNEQLASVKPEAHEAFGRVDGAAAISRIQGIIAAGGGPAGKLSPDAVSKALAGAAQSSSTGNFNNAVTAAGGLGSVATDDLRKAYESVTSKLSSTDHGLNASELANARSAVASMASELGRR